MATPFHISIPNDILDDLKRRLLLTRWPDEIDNKKWQSGTKKSYLQKLCAYWANNFDWQKQENYLNHFTHFEAQFDDGPVHFIHQKGEGEITTPLLLSHGFPDSFFRFHKLISMLTRPDENGHSFDVVIPSIPGYGFSFIPDKPGMCSKQIAHIFHKLMTDELGYKMFIAHGGDWGSSITEKLALYHSDNILGIHITDIPFVHTMEKPENLSEAEKKFFKKIQQWQQTEGAYTMIQSTKPQSLAYGLNDSPAGLAAWVIEKFYTWSDNDGNLDNSFSKDELLTNLTLYWATQTINSAMRLYYEEIQAIMEAKYNPLIKLNPLDKTGKKVKVPTAFALFPKDISPPPRAFAERFFNVQQWTEMPAGGHFASLEKPDLLAADIRAFAKLLRK